MPLSGSPRQRCLAQASIFRLDVGAFLEQQPHDSLMPVRGSMPQRRPAQTNIFRFDIGVFLKSCRTTASCPFAAAHDSGVQLERISFASISAPLSAAARQRHPAVLVGSLGGGILVEQQPHNHLVPVRGGMPQRSACATPLPPNPASPWNALTPIQN